MKFGTSKLSCSRIRQFWPQSLNNPVYPIATAAIRATFRSGYNSLVVRFTQWPITIFSQEVNKHKVTHLALNISYAQGFDIIHDFNIYKIG